MFARYSKYHVFFFILLLIAAVFNLVIGSVRIPVNDVLAVLSNNFTGKASWEYIILEYRLPKLVIACLVGMSLSVAGMMMQTLFQNPMAEPYILGVSSGASLGVAICILGQSLFSLSIKDYFSGNFAIIIFALAGSIATMLIILGVSQRIKQIATLLIVGLMFSSFTSAFVNVLAYFSTAEELKRFTFWNLGSLGNISWQQMSFIAPLLLGTIAASFLLNKSLNMLLMGENYAKSMGINLKKTKFIIILVTCMLVAVCTAFVGPIAFVGLAVPHITRMIYKTTNHFQLFTGNIILGALILVLCDIICQLPGEQFVLPINAVTSILGAPLVIYLILKNR
ncbi:iron complex transport system permease protein [Paenimyroides aquimaris]|uniref:Iron complex transport system permease protein n=1 Tax=Paenimyroides marinum TaxID=1159016 RepID=A0A1H6M6X8_9FLAO|nr:iron ABC transporter permease [Paenimyroides aquimaris]SEH93239.1 iron complex transport system permease protein [Paenimyroides aquimaris]